MIAELAVAAVLAAAPTPAAPGAPAATRAATGTATAATSSLRLDGVPVHLRRGTEQVVTVNQTDGYHARVTFWKQTDNGWSARFSATDGRIGYGGLARPTRRVQGTGTTPLGTYGLPWAFGNGPQGVGWRLRYREVSPGDFWVEDNGSRYYNRYRNQAQGGFRWWLPSSAENSSERLSDFQHQYRIAIVTDFNQRQVRHRGAGIFLHVNGDGATAGCVSAPGPFILKLMRVLDPARVPVIAVGR